MGLEEIKGLIADVKYRIQLHDEVANITQDVIKNTSEENFPLNDDWSKEEFKSRIKEYDKITNDLCLIQALISYWGNKIHNQTIVLPIRMIADYWLEKSGRSIWYILPWYNNLLLFYYTGIAAVASDRYENFMAITKKVVKDPKRPNTNTTMIQAIQSMCSDYKDKFQLISGDSNHLVPSSEYIFKQLQPKFKELIYLGSDFESYFDKFEILMALEYAHQTAGNSPDYINAPIGRFGYKRRGYDNPLDELIEEANTLKEGWLPLQVGLIGGSFNRFKIISDLLVEKVKNLRWGF